MSDREEARRELAALLRLAYSGELAAYIAYHGHERSVRDPAEKAEIRRIGRQELHHRHVVGRILAALGERPSRAREVRMTWIGRGIWLSCFLGGRFAPMYGAARLERGNIGEYVTAARLAIAAGRPEFVDACVEMAEVEWDHERWFHKKARESRWMRLAPDWTDPPPRASYRAEFAAPAASAI
jgi:demethoxyubiquinone hydroxylase (CLK1/Coq7/Cat5 family)